ncbi:MAG: hypothetical protein ACK45H_00345 [Bacteroidota bacterium]|jgi:hypothetical protein
MKRSFVWFMALSAVYLMQTSCTKEKAGQQVDPNCIDTVSFSQTILPLMQTNCTGCHGSGNTTGYTITNHTNISSQANAILNAMRGQGGFQQMPDGLPALPDSMIKKFECWVGQGKQNN